MAKEILTEEYQDDILAANMNGLRKYRMINNGDNTFSFVDVTDYETVGTEIGAAELKRISKNINESADKNKIIDDLEIIKNVTEEGYIAGAKAVGALNNSLEEQPQFVYDEEGKITGYTTKIGGADTVFPFNSGKPSFDYISVQNDDSEYELVVESPINGTVLFMGDGSSDWGAGFNAYINDKLVSTGTQEGAKYTKINHSENVKVGDVVKLKLQAYLYTVPGYTSWVWGLIGIK